MKCVDVILWICEEVENLNEQAYRLSNEHIKKAASYNKQKYDGKMKEVELVSDDRVFVKNVKDKAG